MSASLDKLMNVPKTFVIDGVSVSYVELDVEHMAKFTLWLREEAKRNVDILYANDPAGKVRAESRLDRDCTAGVYDWGQEVCMQKLQTIDGLTKALCISAEQQKLDIEFTATRKVVEKLTYEKAQEIQEAVANDPKGFSVLLASLGGPISSKSSRTNRTAKVKKTSRKRR